MSINLNNCKPGDRLITRIGESIKYQNRNSNPHTTDYPHIAGPGRTYTSQGKYHGTNINHPLDIIAVKCKKTEEDEINDTFSQLKPKDVIDFSSLPKGATKITIDGVEYEKVVKWEKRN